MNSLRIAKLKSIYTFFKFISDYNHFFKNSLSTEQSKSEFNRFMKSRQKVFLKIVKEKIYENTHSPYLKLLNLKNITFEDIEKSVKENGIETTLKILFKKGIYFTLEEF